MPPSSLYIRQNIAASSVYVIERHFECVYDYYGEKGQVIEHIEKKRHSKWLGIIVFDVVTPY